MKYLIADVCIQFDDVPLLEIQQYSIFRNSDTITSDIGISVDYVDYISPITSGKLLYKTDCICVLQDNDTEYLFEFDCETAKVKWALTEQGHSIVLKICAPYYQRPLSEMELFNCVGIERLFSERGRFILHSSFIQTSRGAILFTAPCQTGKSTQAELWRRYRDAIIVNGDRACVWMSEDTWMAGGLPWCGTSGISLNQNVPLRAIVILQQGPENEIKPIRMISKVGRLIEQTTINPWNTDMYQAAQDFWIELCQNIPVVLLSCRPDEGAIDVLEKELSKYDER